MTFTKYLLVSAILAAAGSTTANAADATVNFTGSILSSSCSVSTGSNTVSVPLGNYGPSQFPVAGTTSRAVPFTIPLSTCPTSGGPTTAFVTFVGTAASSNLALASGGASGIAIQIKKQDGTPIVVNTPDAGITLSSNATQNLNFTANYISTADSVGAGAANGTAQVNISYQ